MMSSAETVVEEQVSAYNEHDLERFVATYADDVEIVGRDGHILRGHEALTRTYGPLFAAGDIRAEILGRLSCGEWVVDHERASASGRPSIEVLVAYKVAAGRIVTVRMLG